MGQMGIRSMIAESEATKLRSEYLRRVDAEAVLDHYGPENVIDRTGRNGRELIHSCLIDRVDPHHAHGDANPSASLNVDKKVYNCYSYGGGDIFWLMTLLEGKSAFHEIVPLLREFLGDSTVDTESFIAEVEKYLSSSNAYSKESLPRYHERILHQWDNYHPYLKHRGVSFEAAKRLRIGYDESNVRITFPHWVDGVLVGWQKRKLTDPRWPVTPPDVDGQGRLFEPPKYKNSAGFPKDSTIYNLDRVLDRKARDVLVVESPMSVAKAETFWDGTPDDPFGAVVATFGSEVNDDQLKELRVFDSVTVWMDSDYAGRKSSYRLLDGLWRFTATWHVEPEDDTDLGDYSDRSEAQSILKAREAGVIALSRLEASYGRKRRR
jgi:DNA primase